MVVHVEGYHFGINFKKNRDKEQIRVVVSLRVDTPLERVAQYDS